jgi:hypothetical protein
MKRQTTANLGKGGVFDSPRIRTKDDPIQILFDPAAVFPGIGLTTNRDRALFSQSIFHKVSSSFLIWRLRCCDDMTCHTFYYAHFDWFGVTDVDFAVERPPP